MTTQPRWPDLDPENGDFTDGWNQAIHLCREAFGDWAVAAQGQKDAPGLQEIKALAEKVTALYPLTGDETKGEYDCPMCGGDGSADVEKLAREAAKEIGRDIADRRGLKWEWGKIDRDVKRSIYGKWAGIIAAVLRRSLQPPQAQSWISVKKQMPNEAQIAERKGWFQVANEVTGRQDIAKLLKGTDFMGYALQFSDITHWQPLPALPSVPAESEARQ